MSSENIEIALELDDDESIGALTRLAARKRRVSVTELGEIEVLKRSIDARRGQVKIRYLVRQRPVGRETFRFAGDPLREVNRKGPRIVIIGGGPAGLFCAHQLARAGVASVIVERGKQVQPRRRDLKGLTKGGVVDADSNYCFGEGGAGTFSDGKLYTRAHKRGDVRDVIEILVDNGAPDRILSDARPHIGSNQLPKVVSTMRERLQNVGVEFHFGARVTSLVQDGTRVSGVRLADGREILADAVVVATGHSARDVYGFLAEAGVAMEAKGFAMGVRIEHPQPLINGIQYGRAAGHPKLPAAAYRLVQNVSERGVFSFCMCPGGWIVPASTEPGALVVNGMSLSKRDSPYANSGLVVSVNPEDWGNTTLGGIEVQKRIEEAAWQAGGGELVAPAIGVKDFVAKRLSTSLPASSYVPGVVPADIASVVDAGGIAIADKLRIALGAFDKKMRGYLSDEAMLVGVESRTSSPVRVLRDRETLESTTLQGLYPCGEGAGYAGGIVSAAMDGIRVARAFSQLAPTT